jgi:hypothetical protein
MADADYFTRLEAFAARLRPEAALLDVNDDAVAAWYDRFQQAGLNIGGSTHMPLDGAGFCRALETLAMASGAFAFVALQQFVANMNVGDRFVGPVWPKVGVAFGHLGKPDPDLPRLRDGIANGVAPWLTGAGIFDWVVLGLHGEEQQEVFVLTDAHHRPEFAHTTPLSLLACTGTRTVSVRLNDLPVAEDQILKIDPPGNKARSDAASVLYQTPLMVGCVRACWEIIAASPRVEPDLRAVCEQKTAALLDRIRSAFADGDMRDGAELRAEIGDYSVRIARLAAMASGGGGLLVTHPAQRLYREALVYTLMAQSDLIVSQAFRSSLS